MISPASSQRLHQEWFQCVGDAALPYAVPQSEYTGPFAQAIKATEEQKLYLSEHFDPQNMIYSEYWDFLDTLCQYGVLEEDDKNYANYGAFDGELEMIPLEYAFVGARITPRNVSGFLTSSYAS